ncbi:MAG TPA: helix-turn-helix domain-containing protein [Anaeromyxobacteraceae bacterium]|nr:helix-turn-helix domain-containing protein [Anaeromyxobacteraceae bacterium]
MAKRQQDAPDKGQQVAHGDALARPAPLIVDLRTMREIAGKTQAEVAEQIELSQARVSRAEAQADHRVSFLRKYVAALGGRVDVYARFGGRIIKLY